MYIYTDTNSWNQSHLEAFYPSLMFCSAIDPALMSFDAHRPAVQLSESMNYIVGTGRRRSVGVIFYRIRIRLKRKEM